MKKLIYLAPDVDLSKNEGGKVHTIGEIKYLQEYFDTITLICQNKSGYILNQNEFKQIKTIVIPTWLHKPLFRIFLESPFLIFLAFFYRVQGYRFVIERSYNFGGWFSIFFRLVGGQSLYLMIEPLYSEHAPFLNRVTKIITVFLRPAIKYFLITYPTMSYLTNPARTKLVWTGADLEKFHPNNINGQLRKELNIENDNRKIVFYSGSIQQWHAVDLMLDAAAQMPDILFLLIISGSKEAIADFQEKVVAKKINNILIKTKVPYEQIPMYVNLADICLALYEKNNAVLQKFDYFYCPIKVNEYKACGKPIIATKMGNLTPLVEHCGILIENTTQELVTAIRNLSIDESLYKKYRENCLTEAKNKYNWKKVVAYYDELFG